MATETGYTYSIANDFPGGAVNLSKLKEEIDSSSSIIIGLASIGTVDDVLTIWFKDVLPAAEKTALDNDVTGPSGALIAAHDNTSSVEIQEFTETTKIGGEPAILGGHYMTAEASETKADDFSISENCYLQGVDVYFKGTFGGDKTRMDMLHPAANDNPASSLTTSDNVVTLNTNGKGVYYNPITVSPYMHMEFYDNTGTYKFCKKVSSVSGDAVTLDSNVDEAVATDWTVKAQLQSFCMEGKFFYLLNSGDFKYFQNKAVTAKISAGLIFSVKLWTTATAGTRDLVCNYVCRKVI